MRKLILGAFVALLVVLGMGVGTAQAAADITKGSSCSVSANWSIAGSANFNNTSGSPSTGYVDYLVVNSPGQLGATHVTLYRADGTSIGTQAPWVRQNVPGYVYRMDPNVSNIRRVYMNPSSYTGVYCSEYSGAMNFYSSN